MGRVGDRHTIVSGSDDDTVRVWDAGSGAPIGDPLTEHSDWVNSVAVGRVGGRDIIVSSSSDGTVRIWDLVGTAQEVLDLLHPATSLAIDSAEGLLYVAGSNLIQAFVEWPSS